MSLKSYTGRKQFNLNLIKEVQKYKHLYDNDHPEYRNNVIKDKTWQAIGRVLGESDHLCKLRWTALRKQYTQELSTIETAGSTRKTYWRYTDALSFLKVYETQKTHYSAVTNVISKSDLYCRACLCSFYNHNNTGEHPKSFNIFEIPNLAEIVSQCSNTSVVQYDEYPQRVCEKCYKKFVYFSEFQKMCQSSLEKYNTMVHDPKLVTCDLDNALNESYISLNSSSLEDINICNEIEAVDIQQQNSSNKIPKEQGNIISLYNQIKLFNASTEMGNKEEILHTETVGIEEDNLLHSATRQPNLYNLPSGTDEVSEEIILMEADNTPDDHSLNKSNKLSKNNFKVLQKKQIAQIPKETVSYKYAISNDPNSLEDEEYILEKLLEDVTT
ncbi:uncharacterized protein [Musca autumnalis]|uniref:uncharacterized protein n=1 Tax=Musca autumnalis TaxID=221902 RepID=UPI003CF4D56B